MEKLHTLLNSNFEGSFDRIANCIEKYKSLEKIAKSTSELYLIDQALLAIALSILKC